MHVKDLPASERVVITSSEGALCFAFIEGSRQLDPLFTHIDTIDGAGRFGRVFLFEKVGDAVPLPQPMSADDLARELVTKYVHEAKYPPTEKEGYRKGWEVRKTIINDTPVIIVWSAWAR